MTRGYGIAIRYHWQIGRRNGHLFQRTGKNNGDYVEERGVMRGYWNFTKVENLELSRGTQRLTLRSNNANIRSAKTKLQQDSKSISWRVIRGAEFDTAKLRIKRNKF